jgi:nucleoside-diphosphate-sugar epimerase
MIYGAGSITWTKLLFKLARLNPTPFVGDGRGSTYPIHVDDVVDLLILAAEHPAAAGQVFNCTPDPSSTWREFLGSYARLAGHNHWLALPVLPFALIAGLIGRFASRTSQMHDFPDLVSFFQRRVTYKMEKARDLLGWTPRVDLEMGIASCVPWLREQGLLR